MAVNVRLALRDRASIQLRAAAEAAHRLLNVVNNQTNSKE